MQYRENYTKFSLGLNHMAHTKMLLLLWSLITLLNMGSSEIITLIKEDITCVLTHEDASSTVYLDPPIVSGTSRKESSELEWIYDDWNHIQHTDSLQGRVKVQLWSDSFRTASTPSKEQEESAILIENWESKNVIISVTVSLDVNSSLKIELESDDEEENKAERVKTIKGFNKPNKLRSWEEVKVKVNTVGLSKLSFTRILGKKATGGYWAIKNIRFCNDEDLTEIPVPRVLKHRCKSVHSGDESKSKSTKVSICKKKGFIGSNCDIKCEHVLGEEFKNCEGHKICYENLDCFCAWNYYGEPCEKMKELIH